MALELSFDDCGFDLLSELLRVDDAQVGLQDFVSSVTCSEPGSVWRQAAQFAAWVAAAVRVVNGALSYNAVVHVYDPGFMTLGLVHWRHEAGERKMSAYPDFYYQQLRELILPYYDYSVRLLLFYTWLKGKGRHTSKRDVDLINVGLL